MNSIEKKSWNEKYPRNTIQNQNRKAPNSKQKRQLELPDLVSEYELNKKTVPKLGGLFAYRSDILDDTRACIRQLSGISFKCIATISKHQVNQRIVSAYKKRTKRRYRKNQP